MFCLEDSCSALRILNAFLDLVNRLQQLRAGGGGLACIVQFVPCITETDLFRVETGDDVVQLLDGNGQLSARGLCFHVIGSWSHRFSTLVFFYLRNRADLRTLPAYMSITSFALSGRPLSHILSRP